MKYKIALVGSNSFIAKNLAEYYYGNEIGLFDRTHTTNIVQNLTNFEPDVIINCAAEIYDPTKMFDTNIVLLQNILEYCKTNNNVRLIHIGSSSEYGTTYKIPLHEDLKLSPKDMYQATKGAGTLLCKGYSYQYGVDVAIVRPFSVYGKHEKPHRFFPALWRTFKKDNPIVIYPGTHDFVYIEDFVKAIDQLINMSDFNGDVINVGSGIQYTNEQIVNYFIKVSGVHPTNIKYDDRKIKMFDRNHWVCDTTLAHSRYGIICDTPIDTGIKLFLQTANY